jgi:hypothetical protein
MREVIIFTFICLISCRDQHLGLDKEYEKAVTGLPPTLLEFYKKWYAKFDPIGMADLAIFKQDKLIFPENNNNFSNMEINKLDSLEQDIWFASAILEGRCLMIDIVQPFGYQFIRHKIENDTVLTEFEEYYKSDSIVKINKTDKPSNRLIIPLSTVNVKLSKTSHFAVDDLIYGKAMLTTQPYYLIPIGTGSNFDRVNRVYLYHFKCRVKRE